MSGLDVGTFIPLFILIGVIACGPKFFRYGSNGVLDIGIGRSGTLDDQLTQIFSEILIELFEREIPAFLQIVEDSLLEDINRVFLQRI